VCLRGFLPSHLGAMCTHRIDVIREDTKISIKTLQKSTRRSRKTHICVEIEVDQNHVKMRKPSGTGIRFTVHTVELSSQRVENHAHKKQKFSFEAKLSWELLEF
jgi:hypothetical protein